MVYAFSYLFHWFVDGIIEFFNRWYVKSLFNMAEYMFNLFEELDKGFALKINFRNLFKPLYQDRNIIGYTLGFLFRGTRILIALVAYFIVFSITAMLYLLWLGIPIFFIYKAIKG